MTEELPRKKSVRAAHRAGATRMMNQVGDLLGEETLDVDELTLLQTNLSSKSKTLEALDAQIVELTPINPELEEEIGKADEYFERLQRALMKTQKALKDTPTRDRTAPRRDATREAASGDELTHEATGDDTHVFPDRDEHISDSAQQPTRPSYQYRSDTGPGGAMIQ